MQKIPVLERIEKDQEACRITVAALHAQQESERTEKIIMKIPDRLVLLSRIVLVLVGLLYIAMPDKLTVNPMIYGAILVCWAVSG